MTLTPAYGRDYATRKAVLEAFKADKDFVVADMFSGYTGRVVNRLDLIKGDVRSVNVRYKRNTQVAVIPVK
jgi:hypothetical protein